MTTPKSRLAYQAHFDILDQAMEDPKGIRIKSPDRGYAWRLRLEFHHARDLDRKDNAQTYDVGHMLHGCSVYDQLVLTIEQDRNDQHWLYVHKRDAGAFHVESLSKIEDEPDLSTPSQVLEEVPEAERRF